MFRVQLLVLRIRRGGGSVLSRLKPRQRIGFLGPALAKNTGKATFGFPRENLLDLHRWLRTLPGTEGQCNQSSAGGKIRGMGDQSGYPS
jgi:hypothetical protein